MPFDFGIEFDFQQEGGAQDKSAVAVNNRKVAEKKLLTRKFEYRRAYSEVNLLESMKYERLEEGCSYNFITEGNVDAISYLKLAVNGYDLDQVFISTFTIYEEDIKQLQRWLREGRIRKIDIYVSDHVAATRRKEWDNLVRFYQANPDIGRLVAFANHSKVIGCCNAAQSFYYMAQMSCNMNTNPQCEQCCVQLDKGLYEFYKEWYDETVSLIEI